MKVLMIGTFPPPVGGTSIHVERLYHYLLRNNVQVIMCTKRSQEKRICENLTEYDNYRVFLLKIFFNRKADIVHSHSHSWRERFFLTIKAKVCGQKAVFTFHSFREDYQDFGFLYRRIIKYVLKNADAIIAVSSEIRDKLCRWGGNGTRIQVISPFIYKEPALLDIRITNFIKSFPIILSVNASNNDTFHGCDIYGLELSVKLLSKLQNQYNAGMVMVLTKITKPDYVKGLEELIEKCGLKENILFIKEPIDFLAIIKKSTVFLRPTCTDGWSISISESLFCRVPVVTSDAVKRQEGCIVFKNCDLEDFADKVRYAIDNNQAVRKSLECLGSTDNGAKVLELYKEIL